MRYCAFVLDLALGLAGVLFLTGCAKLVSVNQIVTDKEAVVDPALLGVWHDKDGEDTLIVNQRENHYVIRYVDKSSSTVKLEARLFEAGDARLLDVVASDDDPFRTPTHIPMRVWLDGTTLRFSLLDSDWLKQLATRQVAVQTVEGRTLITAPTDTVRAFLVEYGIDARACGEPQDLQRAQ